MVFSPHSFSNTAHRGLFDNERGVPENSMAAFERAVAAGYAIELDVRMTADRQLVVFHDSNTRRMCGPKLKISRSTLPELRNLTLLGTGERIPRLVDVLDRVAGRVPLLIELKGPVFCTGRQKAQWEEEHWLGGTGIPEALLVRALEKYRGPLAIESFNPLTLLWLQHNAPDIPRGLLGDDPFRTPAQGLGKLIGVSIRGRENAERHLAWTMTPRAHNRISAGGRAPGSALLSLRLDADFIAYDIDQLLASEAERFREAGLSLFTWTVRTPAQLEKGRGLCDGVIFENQLSALDV